MKSISFTRAGLLLVLSLASIFGVARPAFATGSAPSPPSQLIATVLSIQPLPEFVTGDHPTLEVRLTTANGKPIEKQAVRILVNDVRKAQALTDSAGRAYFRLRYKFSAGTYAIKAVYFGSNTLGLAPVTARTSLIIKPTQAVIRTVPPMAGVNFRFDNTIYTSDENGLVEVDLDRSGVYSVEVLGMQAGLLPAHTRMEFSRWNDRVFTASRKTYFPRNRPLEAGFVLNHPVNQVFFDSAGQLVDPARVASVTIRGVGTEYTFQNSEPQWLPANRLIRRVGERLESREILYYFREVMIDGANVITQSEQRYFLRPNDVWPIRVKLYSVRFSARDAMFDFPIGSGIELKFPDGHVEEYEFGKQSELQLNGLARGSYTARVIGAGGSAPPTPIHLSRDYSVKLLVVSYLDMAVVLGIPLLFALLLLFIGRPHLYTALRSPDTYKTLAHRIRHRDFSPGT